MMRETNKLFSATNGRFRQCCAAANIPPSRRQASKFRMGKGKAWKSRHLIKKEGENE